MNADRERLEGLLGPVSDGDVVDWDAVVRSSDPADRAIVEALRDVDRIGSYSRGLQRAGAAADVPGNAAGDVAAGDAAAGDVPRWGELLLLERCGVGAHAEVWRAWDPRLRREVALKLVRPGLPGDLATTADSPLLAEGRALARVRHPHVVNVLGIDIHDGRVGLWMELVRGETLEQLVAASGPLAPAEAARLGREIGAALGAVHAAGLLHRDIKPANVARDADGRWLLADFGLGRPRPGAGGGATAPAGIAGSPMYMAPELLLGAAPDVRSDIYALGLLVWFALAGGHPFTDGPLAGQRQAAAAGPQPPLAARRPDLPPALLAAVEGAIAPAAARRFASASAFVAALAPADAALPAPRRRRTSRRFAGLVAAASVAAALIVAAAAGRLRPGPGAAAGAYAVEASLLRHGDATMAPLADGDQVAPGDRLSLRWRASRPLWVYVLNADDSGEAYLLFPQPQLTRRNPLPADAPVVLPGATAGGDVAWTVTSAGGRETFLVVASPEPLAELEDGAAGLAAPAAGRPVRYTAAPPGALERLRGVGGLAPLPSAPPPGGAAAGAPLARFRALAGRESGVTGVWVREIVLRNPG